MFSSVVNKKKTHFNSKSYSNHMFSDIKTKEWQNIDIDQHSNNNVELVTDMMTQINSCLLSSEEQEEIKTKNLSKSKGKSHKYKRFLASFKIPGLKLKAQNENKNNNNTNKNIINIANVKSNEKNSSSDKIFSLNKLTSSLKYSLGIERKLLPGNTSKKIIKVKSISCSHIPLEKSSDKVIVDNHNINYNKDDKLHLREIKSANCSNNTSPIKIIKKKYTDMIKVLKVESNLKTDIESNNNKINKEEAENRFNKTAYSNFYNKINFKSDEKFEEKGELNRSNFEKNMFDLKHSKNIKNQYQKLIKSSQSVLSHIPSFNSLSLKHNNQKVKSNKILSAENNENRLNKSSGNFFKTNNNNSKSENSLSFLASNNKSNNNKKDEIQDFVSKKLILNEYKKLKKSKDKGVFLFKDNFITNNNKNKSNKYNINLDKKDKKYLSLSNRDVFTETYYINLINEKSANNFKKMLEDKYDLKYRDSNGIQMQKFHNYDVKHLKQKQEKLIRMYTGQVYKSFDLRDKYNLKNFVIEK